MRITQSLLSKARTGTYSTATFGINTPKGSKGTPKEVYEIGEIGFIITFGNLNDEEFNIDNLDFPTGAIEVTNATWTRTGGDGSTESKSFTLEKSGFYIIRANGNAMATSVRLTFPNGFEYYLGQGVGTPGYSSNCYHSSMVYLYAGTYTWKFYSGRYQSTYGSVTCKLFK